MAWIPCGPQVVPKGIGEAALLGAWADVGAATGDGEDEALSAQNLDGAQYRIAANVVLLLELRHRRQRTIAPLALGDPGSEDAG